MDIFSNATGINFSTTADCSEIQKACAALQKLRQENLRFLGSLAENAICSVCGRRAIVTNEGFGDTIVVCPHVMAAIREKCKPMPWTPSFFLGPSLYGLRIEEFDDGPVRW